LTRIWAALLLLLLWPAGVAALLLPVIAPLRPMTTTIIVWPAWSSKSRLGFGMQSNRAAWRQSTHKWQH
jgi:hypothetical protein